MIERRRIQAASTILMIVAFSICAVGINAAPEILGAFYRADTAFAQYRPFWTESWSLKDAAGNTLQYASEDMPIGGSAHVFIRNTGQEPVHVEDLRLEGISLKRAIAPWEKTRKRGLHPASVHFSDLTETELDTLTRAGGPIWWRVAPNPIPAGDGCAEAIVRLRRTPDTETLNLQVVFAGTELAVAPAVEGDHPRLGNASFSPDLDRVYVCMRNVANASVARIAFDGRDVTDAARIETDSDAGIIAAHVDVAERLEAGSFHCIQVVLESGAVASAGLRAYRNGFCYGVWGGRPGKAGDVELARSYLHDLADHNINVQIEMVGSAAIREFLKTPEGHALCRSLGIRRMINDPGKGNTKRPYAYFLVDEPDCGDYRVTPLPWRERVGAMAQPLVDRSRRLREADPPTPQLLNVDLTFKPDNWYIYGQLPDILAADPYYQERLRSAYWEHPDRLPLYTKATYVYAVSRVCQSACEPKPYHAILNSVCHTRPDRRFRYATPTEKRIEVYYAIAAGAKGISYWWYTPAGRYVGCGAKDDPGALALWREIGLLGAEARTAAHLIERSCPVQLPITARRRVWARTLLSGIDTVLILVVNDDYANDRLGTVYQPVEDAYVHARIPDWLQARDAFEISATGTKDSSWRTEDGWLKLDLGTLEVTRLIVATSDPDLRRRVQNLYDQQFAAKVQKLLQEAQSEHTSSDEG